VELTPGQLKLMPIWGSIEAAVSQRASTADLWQAVREAAAQGNLDITGVNAIDLGGLRSMGAQIRNAAANLASATAGASIEGSMVAQAPWARPLAEQNALGMYQVRYLHSVLEDGEAVTAWRTSVFEGAIPATVEGLMAAVTEDAQAVADSHGTSHIGVSGVQILVV